MDVEALPDGTCIVRDRSGTETVLTTGHGLLGDSDPGHDVVPVHHAVHIAMERHGAYRIARSDNPYHELLPAVLSQRVTAVEALAQWREICVRWGVAVDASGVALHTPPDPDTFVRVPYTELHLLGIDKRRADALRNVARHADRLVSGWRTGEPPSTRTASLMLIPGIGRWTAAIAGYVAFCDPDALEVGDFHAKNTVVHALTGRHRGTDEEMEELLVPYEGQRERVLRWLTMDGWHAPAHGPRRPNVSIARM